MPPTESSAPVSQSCKVHQRSTLVDSLPPPSDYSLAFKKFAIWANRKLCSQRRYLINTSTYCSLLNSYAKFQSPLCLRFPSVRFHVWNAPVFAARRQRKPVVQTVRGLLTRAASEAKEGDPNRLTFEISQEVRQCCGLPNMYTRGTPRCATPSRGFQNGGGGTPLQSAESEAGITATHLFRLRSPQLR